MLHLLVLKNCVSRDETLFFLKKKKTFAARALCKRDKKTSLR